MIKYTVLLLTLIISCDMKKKELIEPKAKKIEKILSIHGDDRIDEYYWLNQRGHKDVIDYLNKENTQRRIKKKVQTLILILVGIILFFLGEWCNK